MGFQVTILTPGSERHGNKLLTTATDWLPSTSNLSDCTYTQAEDLKGYKETSGTTILIINYIPYAKPPLYLL